MDKIIKQDCLEYLKKIDLSPLNNKTVLITGANGLIGTWLIYMLYLAGEVQGAYVTIIAISKSSLNPVLQDIFTGKNTFLSLDLSVSDLDSSRGLAAKVDYIIHAATYAQPGKFIRNYLDTIHLNTLVTEQLLKKAKRDSCKFLFLSSSEVYGDPEEGNIPTPEEYPGLCSPVNVRSVYAESKRMGETLCFAYRNFEGVEAKVARISMTYGPGAGSKDERVLAQFMRQAYYNKRIEMIDEGSKIRTFCYIADCALMLLNILLYGEELVYNVGGKDSISIRTLAEELCNLTGSTLAVRSSEQESQNIKVSPERVQLDISKVCEEFRLTDFKPLQEGLKRTLEWGQA